MRLRDRLTVRLTAGVTAALLLIGIPFLFAFHRLRQAQQIDSLAEAGDGLSRIVVDGLRSAMLAGKPHLLDDLIRDLSQQPEVERIVLLDRSGRVAVSSDPAYENSTFDRERDSACQVCHRSSAVPPSSRTILIESGGQRFFRAMSVIPNDSRCHSCHDPALASNGVLLMDLSLRAGEWSFFSGIGSTVALGGVMVLLTIAILALLLEGMVHRPLRAVVSTSERIAGGDLDARVPVVSGGEFGVLAAQVNRMTDYLARSIQAEETHHRELQAIVDSIDDEIVVLDRNRRVLTANQTFRAASPASRGEVTGTVCSELSQLRPCAERLEECPVERVFETGRLQKAVMSRSGPDGIERTIEIHASPVRGREGTVEQVVEVRRDISERRNMEASLAHSERLASLGLLASGISHEVNNPLGAIAATVDGLRRRLASSEEIRSELDEKLLRVGEQVERARSITDTLLKLARPPGTTRGFIEVNRAVTETLAIFSYDMKRAGINCRTHLSERLPLLCDDGSRLGQILMNLILNSIQAMPSGGSLGVATAIENGRIRIEVEDTGEGIPPKLLPRIYEPFFTTKPAGKGTGLGLFITHRLVTGMGGTIDVQSQLGRGTSFTVRVPATSSRRSMDEEQRASHPSSSRGR